MVTFQSQETALRPDAIHALDDLKRSDVYNDRLKERLRNAVNLITATSTQINDRGHAEAVRYKKKHDRRAANGEPENEGDRLANDEYQARVEDLTRKMDLGIRRVIDAQVWLDDMPDALNHVKQKASAASRGPALTQMTTQQTADDSVMDDAADQDQPLVQPDPSQAPIALLDAAFSTNQTKWASTSLTERYSKHNDYVGWYRIVYDAKHPGENPPPMPHASLWFAAEENRDASMVPHNSQSRRQQQSRNEGRMTRAGIDAQSESESDIEIAAERVRIRCPITLLPYQDPLASTKCPHAFEKGAILQMFKSTNDHLPLSSDQMQELSQINRAQDRSRRERQMKIPMVRCPECSVPLSETDLRPDPVLLRKVNRVLEKERRAEEAEHREHNDIIDAEDDEDDGPPRGTQRRNIVHVGSSPALYSRRQSGRVVKAERRSMVPTSLSDDE